MILVRACSSSRDGIGRATMASDSPEVQTKIAFGRAFLVEVERGDRDLATLFAKAFLVQGGLVNGAASPIGEK